MRTRGRALAALILVSVLAAILAAPRAGTALVVAKPIDAPDVIVSLASHEWERLPVTARLAKQWPAARVVLTLPERVTEFNCHDCSNRAHRLELAGVATSRVRIVPLREGGTYGEALAVRRLVLSSGQKRVLVVTSPYHTRRALATFETVLFPSGVLVGVEPARMTSPARPDRWWWAPYDRAYVRYEWAAILYYGIRHGVGWH